LHHADAGVFHVLCQGLHYGCIVPPEGFARRHYSEL
jgi:hypothetical protein